MKIKYIVKQEIEIWIKDPAKAIAHAADIRPDEAGDETPWQKLLRCAGATAEAACGAACHLQRDVGDDYGPREITVGEPVISEPEVMTDDGKFVCEHGGKFYALHIHTNDRGDTEACEMCDAHFDGPLCVCLCGSGLLPIKADNYWREVHP
jgi:hypothetical protein